MALAFDSAYQAFDEERKWRLKSGRTVEDVLYQACCMGDGDVPFSVLALAQSWVIDLGSTIMEGWFERDEWREITGNVPKLAKPTELFASPCVPPLRLRRNN